ncbi:MAG: hypothetical protein K6F58_03170 [Bacteroidales bacterium]|nr:hypothetical protein [Bacteroidales bacterium]
MTSFKLIVPSGQPGEWHRLDCLNWEAGWPYKPLVEFRLWHSEGSGATGEPTLHLEYRVEEQSVRAMETRDGHDVYKDSCVEFFFQPLPDDPHYYNFEFNAIGTMVCSWRTGRLDPEDAPAEVLASVKREAGKTRCGRMVFAPSVEGSRVGFEEKPSKGPWMLRADIPVSALWRSGLRSFSGLRARGNFYKCGDALKVPHFVTFAPIDTVKPDYHRPEFFTELEFE